MKISYVLALLSLPACAAGSTDPIPPPQQNGYGGGNFGADTICSTEDTPCISHTECCQNNGGMVCAGYVGQTTTCLYVCVSNSDCCDKLPSGDYCARTCAFFTGQQYGACI